MMSRKAVRLGACSVALFMGLSSIAQAQSSVGAGPLTGALSDTEPIAGVLTIGRVKAAPGITVQQLGWDDNIFDEPETKSPKKDYVAELKPDVSVFTRLRFVRLSAYAGSGMSFFRTYDSEQHIGHDLRGRVDFLLSRIRPFFGYGETNTRSRPNGEIDARVKLVNQEASGGLAFDLSPHAVVYGAAYQGRHKYEEGQFEDGVDLNASLTRDGYNYEGGLRTDLTPLLSVQVFGSYNEDRFPADVTRDSKGKNVGATFRLAPDAFATGMVTVSYRDIRFVDPGVEPFQGLTTSIGLTYPFLEIGRFSFSARRGVEYSVHSTDAYYVENSGELTYTHRLFGEVDLQGRVARSMFDYSARENESARTDSLDSVAGSLGYNLRNRTRIALNYEYARRKSVTIADRNYQRRRVFLSWLFAF